MISIKDYAEKKCAFASGHRSCSGCAFPIIIRNVMKAAKDPLVVSLATGCMEVTTTIYPQSSWQVPVIHNTFLNSASTISGVEKAYESLKRKGKIKKEIKFLAFGGDGGTYDIGLQALSGALERGHDFVYVLYDNEAYCNTGGQRSSASPFGSNTSTEPVGKLRQGKETFKKDITKIVVAHNIPYVAQAAVHNWSDLYNKAEKAFSIKGPAFINVFSPCELNWKMDPSTTIKVSKLAADTRFWPLYEVENGNYKLNYNPPKNVPVEEYLKTQGRFKHLLLEENKPILQKMQGHIDSEWEKLLKLCGIK